MKDVFLLPSFYEGNPITVTEAQTAGLPCFISDKITQDTKILESTSFIRIDNAELCAEEVLKVFNPSFSRRDCADIVKENGYDARKQVEEIEKIYQL